MKYKNISEKAQKIINDFDRLSDDKNKTYSQKRTLERINSYSASKFIDYDGDDAIFWNISNSRVAHFAKLIGTDTKDFLPYGIGDYNFFQSWALRKMVRRWFNDTKYYQTLNSISEGMAQYGSQVQKKVKEDGHTKLDEVDLINLRFNQNVEWIKDTDVVELHQLTRKELWDKKGIWKDEAINELLEEDKEEFDVWEFWGYFDNADGEPEYKHEIGSGFGDYKSLWSDDVSEEDFPYKDKHLGRYKGRWLRVGVVERLFQLQERMNTLINENAQTTAIASLLLFRSKQGDVIGNVLEQAINGQIINSEDLEQIGISNTGLNSFLQEVQLIENQADVVCMTPSIIQGEGTPASTTFRGLAVMNSNAKSVFTALHQDLGESIADDLVNDIFPDLVTKWGNEPFIEMAEDDGDVERYDQALLEKMKRDALLNGKLITPAYEEILKMEIAENIGKKGRKIIPEKGWINFKWGIKMMPTNESVDKSTMNDTYFNALSMIGANAGLTTIPLFKQYLEDNGISWSKITPEQQAGLEQAVAQGGGGKLPEQRQPDKLLAAAEPK